MVGSVGEFVSTCFRRGTIPTSASYYWKDYSFNRADFDLKDSALTAANPAAHKPKIIKELKIENEPWPIWPPDLFGMTSLLLEQSAIYQKIKPTRSNFSIPDEQDGIDRIFTPWKFGAIAFGHEDPFGILGAHQVALRLAGSLWANGALTISGLVAEMGTTTVRAQATDDELLECCKRNALNAVWNVKKRNSLDISSDVFQNAIDEIYSLYYDEMKIAHKFVGYDHGNPALQAEKLALAQVFQCFEEVKKTERRLEYDNQQRSKLLPLILILWASKFINYHWKLVVRSSEPIAAQRQNENLDASEISRGNANGQFDWEVAAVRLHILADEAGKGMGFSGPLKSNTSPPEMSSSNESPRPLSAGLNCKQMWDAYSVYRQTIGGDKWAPRTLVRCFNDDLGSVLPKARTPGSGCTIRSMSHNLCLLPPRARVRARWARKQSPSSASTFNILLVPYPFQIKSKHVQPEEGSGLDGDSWGYFAVKPLWLYEDASHKSGREVPPRNVEKRRFHELFWKFVKSMLEDQSADVINALVFPEGALDYETFEFLEKKI